MSENAIPQGRPVWIDLTTADIQRAMHFYGSVFEWTFEDMGADFGHYHLVKSRDLTIGGMMGRVPEMMGEGPDAWSVYLYTPDAQATCDKATAHGGSVIVPPMPVGDMGISGMVTDPGGAATGFWQPQGFEGIQLEAVAGAPCWYELFTPAYEASLDFYREVFGWDVSTMSDTEDFTYSTNGAEPHAVAGIMAADSLGEDRSAHWRTYLGAVDVGVVAQRITSLGGSIEGEIRDSPYGPLGEVVDDQGAKFVIVQAPFG